MPEYAMDCSFKCGANTHNEEAAALRLIEAVDAARRDARVIRGNGLMPHPDNIVSPWDDEEEIANYNWVLSVMPVSSNWRNMPFP